MELLFCTFCMQTYTYMYMYVYTYMTIPQINFCGYGNIVVCILNVNIANTFSSRMLYKTLK